MRVYPKDLSEQGVRWAIRREKILERIPVDERDEDDLWNIEHVQKLKIDFAWSLQKYD